MKKFFYIFDQSSNAQKFKKKILKKSNNYNLKKAEVIVVVGGDGFMLKNLRKYYKHNKPFYGINSGNFGFLMNKLDNKNIQNKIIKSKKTIIKPLKIIATRYKKSKKKYLMAINEVSLLRQSRQTAFLNIKIRKKNLIKKLVADGVLVSTPAGSTAYNLSVHGPILSLNSGKMAITPISPFRPRRWKGKTLSDKTVVRINCLSPEKRPVAVSADNSEIRNIKSLKVSMNNKNKIQLLFDKNRSLINRIKIEQALRNIK
tara:strand:+ start:48 stop:821 length:774 start_codon:yes stop_codon:yes gene_type:complete